MGSNTKASKLANKEFETALREGMKIWCIKDHARHHARSSINDFRKRNRAITIHSFMVGRLTWRRNKKKMMNNRHFFNFLIIPVVVYFTLLESIIVYRSIRRACFVSEKA